MHPETRWQQGDRTPQATALEIALAEPSRDSAHLLILLRERLAHLQLPAPTLELALQASDIVKRAAPNGELFPTRQSEDEGLVRLIERLQARLGAGGVHRLCAAEDHRPERASALRSDAVAHPAGSSRKAQRAAAEDVIAERPSVLHAARPIWLQLPEPLAERDARPLLDGRALVLLSGPERIESGWWDDDLAERDYFIAEASDGALVWIYRARLPLSSSGESGWFLHGRFG